MSVRLHYLEVFDGSSGTYKRILVIGWRTSLILSKDLIGCLGVIEHENKRQTAKGMNQV
jgi:hypothetical protein